MWLFLTSPFLSWFICLFGYGMFQTFSDERLTGTMEPGFIVVNNIVMTFAFYRWILKSFALQNTHNRKGK